MPHKSHLAPSANLLNCRLSIVTMWGQILAEIQLLLTQGRLGRSAQMGLSIGFSAAMVVLWNSAVFGFSDKDIWLSAKRGEADLRRLVKPNLAIGIPADQMRAYLAKLLTFETGHFNLKTEASNIALQSQSIGGNSDFVLQLPKSTTGLPFDISVWGSTTFAVSLSFSGVAFQYLPRIEDVTIKGVSVARTPSSRASSKVTSPSSTLSVHDADNPVLKDVSFKIDPGQLIGIVGPTGSGKSTVVSRSRASTIRQKGSVKIDGRDVRDYKVNLLREQIGYVLQDTVLFRGTILENIVFRLSQGDARRNRRTPPGWPTPMSSSSACPRATTPWSASAARPYPVASGSASVLPAYGAQQPHSAARRADRRAGQRIREAGDRSPGAADERPHRDHHRTPLEHHSRCR